MSEKGQKWLKTTKVDKKKPKIGPRETFERFLSVFRPYKYKEGSTDTILYHFKPFLLTPWPKMVTPPHPFTKNFPKIPTLSTPPPPNQI
jgi:hypothetical protein